MRKLQQKWYEIFGLAPFDPQLAAEQCWIYQTWILLKKAGVHFSQEATLKRWSEFIEVTLPKLAADFFTK